MESFTSAHSFHVPFTQESSFKELDIQNLRRLSLRKRYSHVEVVARSEIPGTFGISSSSLPSLSPSLFGTALPSNF